MYIRESIDFNGRELALETGQLARQAGGAVLAICGYSHVLVTAVTAPAAFSRPPDTVLPAIEATGSTVFRIAPMTCPTVQSGRSD